jgi:hypothetical protein
MGFNDANMLLSGPRQPIAKFEKIGDSVTGTLLDAEVAPITSPTGEVQVDKNGNPKQQIIYTLQTEERDPEIDDDDGKRRVYAKWAIQKAISECLADAGLASQGLQEGGVLTVTHTATQKASQRGYSDIKLFKAEYVPPPARKLPSGPTQVASAAAAVSASSYTDEQVQMAYQIHTNKPDTPLSVISAATGIPEADLEGILPF